MTLNMTLLGYFMKLNRVLPRPHLLGKSYDPTRGAALGPGGGVTGLLEEVEARAPAQRGTLAADLACHPSLQTGKLPSPQHHVASTVYSPHCPCKHLVSKCLTWQVALRHVPATLPVSLGLSSCCQGLASHASWSSSGFCGAGGALPTHNWGETSSLC